MQQKNKNVVFCYIPTILYYRQQEDVIDWHKIDRMRFQQKINKCEKILSPMLRLRVGSQMPNKSEQHKMEGGQLLQSDDQFEVDRPSVCTSTY